MISVVCWLWQEFGQAHAGRVFLPEHVNVLRRMFARHLSLPHRFVCVADTDKGLDDECWFLKTPEAAAQVGLLRNPEGPRFPSCYRRLWAFSPEAAVLGERLLVVDIDLVVVGGLDGLFAKHDRFVGWRPRMAWGGTLRIGGGIYLLTTGSHPEVWEDFARAGKGAIAEARAAGYRGSDQAWLSYKLGGRCPIWPEGSGLYSIRDMREGQLPLPKDARLVQFNGPTKPWQSHLAWVKEHWR